MKKTNLFFLIILLLASIVYADRTCQEIQEANVPCQIITPVISGCSTYDLYNSTLDLAIDDGTMSEIGSTGMYNFTFNQPDEGTHKILLCDNTSATLEVADYSSKNIYDNNLANSSSIRGDIITVQADLDNPNQYKADVSALATTAQLQQNTSAIMDNITSATGDIISRGDSAWTTATGFQTESDASTRYDNLIANQSNIKLAVDVAVIGIQSNRTLTEAHLSSNFTEIQADFDRMLINFSNVITNQSNIKLAVDVAVIGIQSNRTLTEAHLSSNFTEIQADFDRMLINFSNVIANQSNIKLAVDVAVIGIEDNRSDLETHGDANWATATGFATSTALDNHFNALANVTAAAIWGYATRTLSAFSFAVNLLTNAVNDTTIKDDAITASKIAASAIGASELATDSITSDELATSAIAEIDAHLNTSHGPGNWSDKSDATVSNQEAILTGIQSNRTLTEAHLSSNFTEIQADFDRVLINFSNVIANQSNIKLAVDTANIGIQNNRTVLQDYMSDNFTKVDTNLTSIREDISTLSINVSQITNKVWNASRTAYRIKGTFGNLMRKIKTALHIIE